MLYYAVNGIYIGVNNEAVFKAFAQALRAAKAIDPNRSGEVPSTKGTL